MAMDFNREIAARRTAQRTEASQQSHWHAEAEAQRSLEARFAGPEMIHVSEIPFLGNEGKTALRGLASSLLAAHHEPQPIIRSWYRVPIVRGHLFGIQLRNNDPYGKVYEDVATGWFVKLGLIQTDGLGGPGYAERFAILTPENMVGAVCKPAGWPTGGGHNQDIRRDQSTSAYDDGWGGPSNKAGYAIPSLNDYGRTSPSNCSTGYKAPDRVVTDFVINELALLNIPWVDPN